MKRLLFSFLFVLTAIAGWAQTTFTQGDFTYTVTDDETKTVSVKATSTSVTGDLVIPSSVTNEDVTYSVTRIEAEAFKSSSITSVSIPASVLTIGNEAFNFINALVSVRIEDGDTPLTLENYYYGAFHNGDAGSEQCTKTIYLGRNIVSSVENRSCTEFNTVEELTIGPKVTALGDNAFNGCTGLQSVDLSNATSLTSIGVSAFYGCSNLASIDLSQSQLTTISDNTFFGCSKMTSITMPSTVTRIGAAAFRGSAITSVSIPASVLTIGNEAFNFINALVSVRIEDGDTPLTLENNYYGAFQNGEAGGEQCTKTIYLGRNIVSSVENRSCTEFNTVEELTIGPKVTALGDNAFNGCTGLQSVDLSNATSLTSIGVSAFYGCSNLASIDLSQLKLTTIGAGAFYGCSKLTTLDLGTTLTAIPENMLFGCSALTGITIPASVQSVGAHAFYDCDGLTSITIEDSETALEWNGTDYHPLNEVHANYTLYLGRNLTTADNWCFFPGATSVVIGDQVTSVNPHLFEGATKLANVTMGSGVTTIGASAFQNTGTDESVTAQSIALGANVITIGDYAFSGCNKLTTLALGRKLTAIPENMLFSCSALTGITIPASVQSVGAHAFYDCDGLTSITIEDSETALEWNGTDYHPLNEVHANYTLYLGRNLTTEGNQCFFPGATSVMIGDRVTAVNPYLFDGANKLASVTMGSGVTTIGDYAFQNTGTDESVTAQSIALGANVITIGDYAFSGCNKLTTLALGRKLTAIPENMLFSCSALTSITIPASVQSVGAHAFYDCDGLTAITIEDGETALQWLGTDYHPLNEVNSNYTLYLGRDLTTEGNQCFFPGATSVEFGPQVTAIPNNLFSGAELSSVKVPWLTPIAINENVFASGAYSSATLFVPAGTKEAYAAASIWENFTNIDHWSTLVTLTASTHGSIVTAEATASNGTEQYRQPKEDAVVYTLTADEGYELTALTDNEEAVSPLPALSEQQTRTNAEGEEFVTLNATFSAISYTLNYELAGGSVATANPANYTIESAAITLNNPTKNGYTFSGWKLNGEGDAMMEVTIAAGSTGNKSYTATWTPIEYQIALTLDGGSAENPATYTIESEAITLNNPTKTGHTFKGWKLNGEGDALMEVTIAHGSTGDKAYTATWQINQYTISFNSNGGTEVDAIKQDYASEVTAPDDPTRTGYTFAGWTPAVPETIPAENIELTAQWTINQYTITFNSNGGTEVDAIQQNYASEVTAPANPTREGYTFAGWDAEIPATIPAQNVTINATWTAIVYTLSYNLDGGDVAEANPTNYTIESETFTLNNPTRDGYDFLGWTGTGLDAATESVVIATGSTGDRSYTATWGKKSFTVSITGGGVTADNYSPMYGDNVVITIEEDEDRTLNTLTVNGEDVTAYVVDGQYAIHNVTGNVVVVATFNATKEFITLAQGVGTFSCAQDLNFTGSELKAYIAAGYNKAESQVLLVRVYDVPAGTGLYLKGEADVTYKIPYSTSQAYYMNMLKANLTASSIAKTSGDMSNFLLNKVDGEYGFFAPSETATLGAQKAYLQVPTSFMSGSEEARGISIAFEDDETTNISNFELFTNSNEHLYNLKGQRVEKAGRGVYIKNGKKILIK